MNLNEIDYTKSLTPPNKIPKVCQKTPRTSGKQMVGKKLLYRQPLPQSRDNLLHINKQHKLSECVVSLCNVETLENTFKESFHECMY